MVKLILIRHAESIANAQGITQGQKIDEPLSDMGKLQAKKLANRLKKEDIKCIYSSDSKRAIHTAEEISKVINTNIKLDKRLREKDHKNEKKEDFITRCKLFLDEVKKYAGTIVIVSHGGTNRTLLAISTGNREKGAKLVNNIKQYNACINELIFTRGKWVIQTINNVDYLNESEITSK